MFHEEINKEIKKFLEANDNIKPTGCSKSSSKSEVNSNTILSQEIRRGGAKMVQE